MANLITVFSMSYISSSLSRLVLLLSPKSYFKRATEFKKKKKSDKEFQNQISLSNFSTTPSILYIVLNCIEINTCA